MVRRNLHKLEQPPPGYTYAEAEAALVVALDVHAKDRTLLRARLKNLQRLGLPGTAPGKGARARYTHAQVGMWLLAMLVADTGIDPTIVVQAIRTQWKELEPWIPQATDWEAQSESPVWIALSPRLAAGAWKSGSPSLEIQMFRLSPRSNALAQLTMAAGANDRWISWHNFTRPSTRLKTFLVSRP
jgi:hypothetical protein